MKEKKENAERNKENEPIKGPLKNDEDVSKNPDPKIDQDFPGYPHNPSRYELINPKQKDDKKTADLHEKDGEKINYTEDKDEPEDDGSGGAFEGTEEVRE